MNRILVVFSAALVAAAVFAPATEAQQPLEERLSHTFLANRVVIDVQAEVPGELQVVRGRSGQLLARALSEGGLAAAGLEERGTPRLNLTGVGGERVTYVVVVPARTQVTVRLPDRIESEGMSHGEGFAVFRWTAAEVQPDEPDDR